MKVTRTIRWEYERKYNSIEEAKNDEDEFMGRTMCDNGELYSNELTDESGNSVEEVD